eukprot:2941461-Rhodomonas_salina.1
MAKKAACVEDLPQRLLHVAQKRAPPSMCCCWQVRSTAILRLWRQAMCCSKGPLLPALCILCT